MGSVLRHTHRQEDQMADLRQRGRGQIQGRRGWVGKMERNVFYGEDSPEDNHELADIFEALSNDDRPRPEDRVEGKEIKNLMPRKV